MTSESTRPARPGLRHVAILALLTFGCTTVRAPASAIGETVAVNDGAAEPQLELWIESARAVPPAESERVAGEAREVLRRALEGRSAPEADEVLVVREQGVTRTASRRSDQRNATIGMVVGAVVVVAAIVVLAVTSRGKGGGGKGGSGGARGGGRSAAPGRAIAPAGRPTGVSRGGAPALLAVPRPAPGRPAPASRVGPRPAPGRMSGAPAWSGWPSGPSFELGVWFQVGALEPYWDPSAGFEPAPWPAPLPDPGPGLAAPEEPITAVTLAPPPPLPVGDRGFWAGDETTLELVRVDRWTGLPRWVKTVRAGVDPRDAAAVRRLLDRALADEKGWQPAAGEG